MSELVLQFGIALTAMGLMLTPLFVQVDLKIERAAIILALGMTRLASDCTLIVFGS
jgi:hypothetical protein